MKEINFEWFCGTINRTELAEEKMEIKKFNIENEIGCEFGKVVKKVQRAVKIQFANVWRRQASQKRERELVWTVENIKKPREFQLLAVTAYNIHLLPENLLFYELFLRFTIAARQ